MDIGSVGDGSSSIAHHLLEWLVLELLGYLDDITALASYALRRNGSRNHLWQGRAVSLIAG